MNTRADKHGEAYWLIERGSPAEWWAGTDRGVDHYWTRDVSTVHPLLKFPTREGALYEADRIKHWSMVAGSELRVTEHLDCAGPTHAEIDALPSHVAAPACPECNDDPAKCDCPEGRSAPSSTRLPTGRWYAIPVDNENELNLEILLRRHNYTFLVKEAEPSATLPADRDALLRVLDAAMNLGWLTDEIKGQPGMSKLDAAISACSNDTLNAAKDTNYATRATADGGGA